MFDLSTISANTENPSFITILFTVLCSFLLACLIAFTYDKTSRKVARPDHYIQALVLVAIVAATVMQAIGDSLARGLGMLGALAIIRFRTTLRDPRHMAFMFASIAGGIACGVFGFVIAFVGTGGFCIAAFLLRYTPFSKKQRLIGVLKLEMPYGEEDIKLLETILKKHCDDFALKRYTMLSGKKKQNMVDYEYTVRLEKIHTGWNLSNELKEIPEIKAVRLEFLDSPGEV